MATPLLYTNVFGAKTLRDFGESFSFLRDWCNPVPNVVIYGCKGGGKSALAKAWLQEILGRQACKLKPKEWWLSTSSGHGKSPSGVTILESPVHSMMDPSGWGQHDRNILVAYIRERCSRKGVAHFLQETQQKHVLVIRNADTLSKPAQKALKLILDEHNDVCATVLLTRHLSRLDNALLSRCRQLHKGFDESALYSRLCAISIDQGFGREESDVCRSLARDSFGDWRQALNNLQLIHVNGQVDSLGWLPMHARRVLDSVPHKQSHVDWATVDNIRCALVSLMIAAGPDKGGGAVRSLALELISRCTHPPFEEWASSILQVAWESNALMCRGTKRMVLVHLELFILRLWSQGLIVKD